uniref:NADH dehydrogenase subunit 6 n=1 Tax=Heterakis beramporia TaxID=596434 RepID=A0A142I178_9BILA|nr:NADH dehydrogenase subunit 6 [Heterakis beramporia]AMR36309.1 NADH dehydrogenase subunit 6 [Heterakis beramporia]
MSLFFVVALISCIYSYLNINPMKSSLLLVLTMLMFMPLLSFFVVSWYSYFICLLFLSGVFVILVYFSGFSKMVSLNVSSGGFLLLLTLLLFVGSGYMYNSCLDINNFYYDVNWFLFFCLVVFLLFFMNFVSYFLGFVGALRKL